MSEKLTESFLISEVKKLGVELGRTPKYKEFKYSRTAAKTFNSWNNFLSEAGFKELHNWEKIDLDNLKLEVIEMTNKLGHSPTMVEFGFSKAVSISNKYKSWGNFLSLCGLPPSDKSNKHTKESLLSDVRALAKRLNKTPLKSEFPFRESVLYYFESWDEFILSAGLVPPKKNRSVSISDDQLIKEVRSLANDLKRVPKSKEFKRYSTARERYKTWTFFLITAGLERPEDKCIVCGNEVRRKGNKFCSRKCYAKSKQNTKECVVCGKSFAEPPSSEKVCCSTSCGKKNRQQLQLIGTYDNANAKWLAKKDEYFEENKGEKHPNAKYWRIKSPNGKTYETVNLKDFIRQNIELFDGSTVRQAFDGIVKIKASEQGKRKRPVKSYKGWTLLDWHD